MLCSRSSLTLALPTTVCDSQIELAARHAASPADASPVAAILHRCGGRTQKHAREVDKFSRATFHAFTVLCHAHHCCFGQLLDSHSVLILCTDDQGRVCKTAWRKLLFDCETTYCIFGVRTLLYGRANTVGQVARFRRPTGHQTPSTSSSSSCHQPDQVHPSALRQGFFPSCRAPGCWVPPRHSRTG